MAKALVFGEVLWDLFGEERQIGGAPFNFCGHLSRLGDDAALLSAVGTDPLADETLAQAIQIGINTAWILRNSSSTGRCLVERDETGTPHYNVLTGVAYDHVSLSEEQLAAIRNGNYDLFYFGTLAQRNEISRKTLVTLLQEIPFPLVFCDINIRPPFFSAESLGYSLSHCHIVKVSREEFHYLEDLGLVTTAERCEAPEEAMCIALAEHYRNLRAVILTLDKDGAMICDVASGRILRSSKPQSKLVSAVGAGDSFSACFIHNLLAGRPLEECLERSILLSDYVVTQLGALPEYPDGLLEKLS